MYDDSNQQDYSSESIDKKQSGIISLGGIGFFKPFQSLFMISIHTIFTDAFIEYVKMFAIQHSAFEMPNFFSNRISVNARVISPSLSSPSRYIGQPFRAAIYRQPSPPPTSPLNAISDGLKDRLKAIYPGTLWYDYNEENK